MKLLLFGTSGCHLCEEAARIISAVSDKSRNPVIFDTVDISEVGHEHWHELYAVTIPVLYHAESEQELPWPFTEERVYDFIQRITATGSAL